MQEKKLFSSEAALLTGLIINSFGVPLMVHGGFGISTISSLSLVLSEAFPRFTFGAWNYIFQTFLIILLIAITRRLKWSYLFSFVTGIAFGCLLDIFEPIVNLLPTTSLYINLLYYFASFLILTFGISLMVNCNLPIIPTDVFPRDFAKHFGIKFNVVKTCFDLICLASTLVLSIIKFESIVGVGVGTVFYAFFTGKMVGMFNDMLTKHFYFKPCFKILNIFAKEN